MNSNRFILGKGPFIRKADHKQDTNTIMRDLLIALIPLMIFGWIKNGLIPFLGNYTTVGDMLKPIFMYLIAGATSFSVEYLFYFFTAKEIKYTKDNALSVLKKTNNSFALIPAFILALMLPISAPLWTVVFACVIATLVGKLLFGGFGNNIFNPALVGYVVFGVCYGTSYSVFNVKEAFEITAGCTPLQYLGKHSHYLGEQLFEPFGGILNSFIGLTPGTIGETSALLCLVAFVWLTVRGVIDWRIPVTFVGGVFVLVSLANLIGTATLGIDFDIQYVLFHILNGGLMFGAVFMATEPVTGCKTPNGKIVFALGLAVITVLLRFASNLPEGVGTSILTMNLFAPLIDRTCAKVRSSNNKKTTIITYVTIGLILGIIAVYGVMQGASSITSFYLG